ncbi:MAG: hydantoinase B/oxoprolinase family protein [Planctomycetota bacterium]|nr:hydantoinase B/oxoprolinase family protein [Planctomycetota bacterium]
MRAEMPPVTWHFWIDRGGTFTDIVAWHPSQEDLRTAKVLSEDPARHEDASLSAIRSVLELDATAPLDELGSVAVRLGTTVATNALLTRSGEPTVMVMTEGLGDLLLLGDQTRPRLFELNIHRPSPSWAGVIEARERIGINGEVIHPLDEVDLKAQLQSAVASGVTACAVSLLHGWQHTAHEQRVLEIAREVGLAQAVASHQVCPLQGLLARSQTTLVDATLTPPLQRSIEGLAAALPEARLQFMQSSGGLADPAEFRGSRAVLSGPAGGIVGAAAVARVAGCERIITFDMGGTSTDVAWHDGSLYRTWDTRLDGLRLRVPMLEIDTIAAGGGSVCRFDGQRLRVGPESAGANPGPACYRMGGPATVTDCQVVLGRLDADLLPSVFGADRKEPINPEASRASFEAIAKHMPGQEDMSIEAIAEGCLRIAVERMAAAVRRISIEQGRSLEDVTMVAFGGAGGQAACLVAQTLGIKRVLIHPQAGVLSALGIGLAKPRLSTERTLGCPVESTHEIAQAMDVMEADLSGQLLERGVSQKDLQATRRVHLQVQGWDGSISVEESTPDEMQRNFYQAARDRYGFELPRDASVIVDMVEVEVVSNESPELPVMSRASGPLPEPIRRTQAWFQGQLETVGTWSREMIPAGARIDGPAIVAEQGATTIVEPGWSLTCSDSGDLFLEHHQATGTGQGMTSEEQVSRDPVLLEVFGHRFMSIAEEMGATLRRTAHSVNIKERLDFSCAIFNASGQLVANGPHVPVHLGSMDHSVRAVIDAHGDALEPGDAWLLNDPYHGGTHLPDLTVVTPVFDSGGTNRLFLVASRGHHADVGGRTPGSMPADSRTLSEEGVVVAPVRIVHRGQLDEAGVRAKLAEGPYPARNIDQNIADLRAQLAANARGVLELNGLVETFGVSMVQACMAAVMDNGEACVRSLLPDLKEGSFTTDMDDGSRIQLTVSRNDDDIVFDFSGTSEQCETNFNAPPAVTRAAVLYVLRCLIDDEIPLNEGCMRPVHIVLPEGSLLNPRSPAAVVAGNVETSQCVVDTILAALEVQAASQGTMNNITFGDSTHQYYETVCGGVGAGPGFHGADAVHSHMTNSRLTDPEILERRFPVRLVRFAIRHGSGGRGRWRGGAGAIRELRFLEPMTLTLLSGRRRIAPFGLVGGVDGQVGMQSVHREDGRVEAIGATASVEMGCADSFVLETPGGGGFQPPDSS